LSIKMKVYLNWKVTCGCGQVIEGFSIEDAFEGYLNHKKKKCCNKCKFEYYLVDGKGESVEGFDEILKQLDEAGFIYFPD